VLCGVQEGLSNKEIGKRLNVSERTVKFHISALLTKFDVAGRMGLMRKATELLSTLRAPTSVESPQLVASELHGAGEEIRLSRESPVQLKALERRSRA